MKRGSNKIWGCWSKIVLGIFAITFPFIWLKPGYLWVPEEKFFINYQIVIWKNLYAWSGFFNGGYPALPVEFTTIIPNAFFYYIFSLFNIPNILIQRFFLIFVIFFMFFSVCNFLKLFSERNIVIFLGCLFYFLNFYTRSTFFYSAKMYQMILMPLGFLFCYKYLKYCKLKYAIYNFLIFFLFQGIFCNLPQIVTTLTTYVFAILYYLISERTSSGKETVKRIFVFFIFLLPLFFYQFLPYYFSMYQKLTKMKKIATFTALKSPLYLLFQLRGSWWEFKRGIAGVLYNPWLHFYNLPLVILISFLLIIICFSGFFVKKAKKKSMLFWSGIFLLAISLAKGISFPFGSLYKWMFHNIPFFYIFREPWAKFTSLVVLSLTVLFVLSLNTVKRKSLIFIILILLLIRGFPFFSSNFFDHINKGRYARLDIKIPDYWYKFSNWTKHNLHKSIFILPIVKKSNGLYLYNWYNKDNIGNARLPLYYYLTYTHNFCSPFSVTYKLFSNVPDLINLIEGNSSIRILSLFNINYFLDQKDVDTKDKKILVSIDNLKKTNLLRKGFYKSFGKLNLYRISNEHFLPHIYSSLTPFVVEGGIDELVFLAKTKYLNDKPILFLSTQENNQELEEREDIPKLVYNDDRWELLKGTSNVFQEVNKDEPNIIFKKINPTKYLVKVEKAKRPFWLVFSESFHKKWKLYKVNESPGHKWQDFDNIVADYPKLKVKEAKHLMKFTPQDIKYLFRKPLSVGHYLVNGYANSWYIEPKKLGLGESFVLIIYFWPQSFFYLGVGMLALTLGGCVGYLIIHAAKGYKR